MNSEGLSLLSQAIKDPVKKKIIAKDDTIIGGLVLILSNQDMSVVVDALNILLSLSGPVDNRQHLREFIGMTDQLTVLSKDTNPLDHIRELSARLLARLNSSEPIVTHGAPNQRNTNVQPTTSQRCSKPTSHKPFFLPAKLKTVILQVDGLIDKGDMECCRQCLLTVKGVVSITFDPCKHRAIVRAKPEITAQRLASSIHKSDLVVTGQVLKSADGQETVVELPTDNSLDCNSPTADKENSALPDYLPDEDSPVKVDDRAMRRFGAKDDPGAGSWLGAAASFLAKSFYW